MTYLGVPLFVSYPHFYGGDASLREAIDGLKTLQKKDVETYLNIHPTMGFSMTGKARLQLNIQVQKAFGVHQLDRYEDGLLLPLAWFDIVSRKLLNHQNYFPSSHQLVLVNPQCIF